MGNINKNEEDFMKEVRLSLSEQVREELSENGNSENGDAMAQGRKAKKKKKKGLILKISLFLIIFLFGLTLFLRYTGAGRRILAWITTEYIYSKLDYEDSDMQAKKMVKKDGKDSGTKTNDPHPEEGLEAEEITDNINLKKMSETFKNARHQEGVYNILLLGVEAIFEGAGRTDSIMIATINTKLKTIGLTSIMRDTYVKIPGYNQDRINTVFAKGGVKLLYETIAENFGVRLDGSVIVGFDAFQQVIDDLGGVDIELTAEEARYLNTTNYISKKKYRNVKPGKNHMNGNQALGYARVRKISTLDGSHSDMGRTSRHRRVMNAIFKKFKKSDPFKILKVMNTVIPKVKTDVKKNNAKSYLAELLDLTALDVPLDSNRIPDDTLLAGQTVPGIGQVVISKDWEETKRKLTDFIFTPHKREKEEKKKGAKTSKTK